MLGRYRHIFFALVGWLALANTQGPSGNTQQPKAETNQTQPTPAPSPPPVQPVEQVESPKLYRPCDQGQDYRNSDLCAQWKAADAARDAADWTYWGVLLGIVGTIGLFWTLYYTRAAVKAAQEATKDADAAIAIAARNADAAADLAETSREAMQNDLRGWVGVTCDVGGCRASEHGLTLSVTVNLKNYGKSPVPVAEVSLITYARTNWATGGAPVRRAFTHQPFQPIMPGKYSTDKFSLTFDADQIEKIVEIASAEHSGVILGFRVVCRYATIFDDRRTRPRLSKASYVVFGKPGRVENLYGAIGWVRESLSRDDLQVWSDLSGHNLIY
jgi:hypothetical protein